MWISGFRFSWRKIEVPAHEIVRWRQLVCGMWSRGTVKPVKSRKATLYSRRTVHSFRVCMSGQYNDPIHLLAKWEIA